MGHLLQIQLKVQYFLHFAGILYTLPANLNMLQMLVEYFLPH